VPILRISLFFSLISGNLARRLVGDRLGPQPSDKPLILKCYSVFRRVEFGAVWRHFLTLIRDPISGGDVWGGCLSLSRAPNLSGSLSWLNSCALKAPVPTARKGRLLWICRSSGKEGARWRLAAR
jgi:hypothetical protein